MRSNNCNSLRLSDAHMHLWTKLSLLKIATWCQAIIWTNVDILSITHQRACFNGILSEIQNLSLKNYLYKFVCKMVAIWLIRLCWPQWTKITAVGELTHWGRVTHICVSDLTSIGSDNGMSPGRRQAIIRTNAGILLIKEQTSVKF